MILQSEEEWAVKMRPKHILAMDPQAKMIVSSGYSIDSIMAHPEEHGFCEVLPKPFIISDPVRKAVGRDVSQGHQRKDSCPGSIEGLALLINLRPRTDGSKSSYLFPSSFAPLTCFCLCLRRKTSFTRSINRI